jgi:hypothetical protein
MTTDLNSGLQQLLLRDDGQENVCLATYTPSTGQRRSSALLNDIVVPRPNETYVHGNASFTGAYLTRAASRAAQQGRGVALLHSHPGGAGWQSLSDVDRRTEASFSRVAETISGFPLVGMTLAGDGTWSARSWNGDHRHRDAENVRVVGTTLHASWNPVLRPAPAATAAQIRTVSAWGSTVQADLARLRVLVVGAGTVGMDVAIRLAQTGIEHITVMDFDTVNVVNLDRLLAATYTDAALWRPKIDVARRAMHSAATATNPTLTGYALSVCEPAGQRIALDHDVIFCCVDRPWPRAVLNQLAYSDLVTVIDGGVCIETFPDGGMRNATWRAHVVGAGRPCLQCSGQITGAQVTRDRVGLFDDASYITAADQPRLPRQNVSLIAPSVTASMLAQFVSLVAAPGGIGVPQPLRFSLSTHCLEHLPAESAPTCPYELQLGSGDARSQLTGRHQAADLARKYRSHNTRSPGIRLGRLAQNLVDASTRGLEALARVTVLARVDECGRRVTEGTPRELI